MSLLMTPPATRVGSMKTLQRPANWISRSSVKMCASVSISSQFTKIKPTGSLVLAKPAEVDTKTAGGVLLPTSSQQAPTTGSVVELGDGRVSDGQFDFTVKPGDTILYSKYKFGTTELELGSVSYFLIKEEDVLGVLPFADATASDVPELQPLHDRVLVKVQEHGDISTGGVLLPDSAKGKPLCGEVVAVGPGKRGADGKRSAPKLTPGDRVVYFKYAGDTVETGSKQKYVILHEQDILAKL